MSPMPMCWDQANQTNEDFNIHQQDKKYLKLKKKKKKSLRKMYYFHQGVYVLISLFH